ncbi:hypothetical protein EES44_24290 [Streptomyces sp. ADI96-15]|uniref:hypothetical protein n=1 Tax=Streptomyces TaxID=1883 RepID=UPI000F54DF42|nr:MULTISPECIES: hypothetical protein [Streptomyces]MDH6189125.1 hypothetical protein [Streptomyces sp. CZ24]RPK58368.1 hypothetical protein EES44_24290 [Streptomyces sp. ADI96-15]RWZ77863.1 hypothetical protein EQK42_00605 [Streptomyces albidoflavus]
MGTSGHYTPPSAPAPRQARARVVTNSSGNAVATWSPPFDAPPIITATVEAGAGFRSLRVAANSSASTTVHVDQTNGVTLLGIGVLAVGTDAVGVTVHVTATEA